MKIPTLSPALLAVTHGLALVAGLCLGWALWHPRPAPPETYAPAIHQPDRSVVLARVPDAHAKAGMIVPRGGTVVRTVQVVTRVPPETTVVHDTVSVLNGSNAPILQESPVSNDSGRQFAINCPPDTIDLALVRQKDQTERVIAKSRHGQILGGVDIPIERTVVPRPLVWSAGPVYNVGAAGWGGAVTRDVGPFRVLAVLTQQRGNGLGALIGAAVRF